MEDMCESERNMDPLFIASERAGRTIAPTNHFNEFDLHLVKCNLEEEQRPHDIRKLWGFRREKVKVFKNCVKHLDKTHYYLKAAGDIHALQIHSMRLVAF